MALRRSAPQCAARAASAFEAARVGVAEPEPSSRHHAAEAALGSADGPSDAGAAPWACTRSARRAKQPPERAGSTAPKQPSRARASRMGMATAADGPGPSWTPTTAIEGAWAERGGAEENRRAAWGGAQACAAARADLLRHVLQCASARRREWRQPLRGARPWIRFQHAPAACSA
eukprot:scaffold5391_cov29-Tisochrysis_lutea.AAC.1